MCCNETENASERQPAMLFVWGSTDHDAKDAENAAHITAAASGYRITGIIARSVSPLLWVVDRGDYDARLPLASESDYFAVWELYDPIATEDTAPTDTAPSGNAPASAVGPMPDMAVPQR